jgi:hypothetical protein
VVARKAPEALNSVEEYLALVEEDDVRARAVPVAESVWLELLVQGYSKRSILLHKQLPITVLEILAKDIDPTIRSAVADKRAASPLLGRLALDESASVRARVACNAKATCEVLERLVDDSEPFVANAARKRLGLPLLPAPPITRVLDPRDADPEET